MGIMRLTIRYFTNYSVKKFKSFVLRNGGNDWDHSLIRDGVMQNLVKYLDLERQAFRPSLVYLNGEFWGIYNIREKVNEDFFQAIQVMIKTVLIF